MKVSLKAEFRLNPWKCLRTLHFLMHKHGDPDQPDDINEWLDQFETI